MSIFSKRTTLILSSLLLAGLGFLLGFHWKFLGDVVSGLLPRIDRTSIEWYVQNHPAEAGLAYAFIGALIVPTVAAFNVFLRFLRERRSIIHIIFRNEDAVHIVASHLPRTSFDKIGTSEVIMLPSNAPLLPSHTAMSLGVLSNYARQDFDSSKPILLHFDTDNWGTQTHCFISVGGPFTNHIAKEILEQNLVPGFDVGDPLSIVDEEDTFEAKRASTDQDAAVTTDYGALIYMENPHDNEKRILLIFGLWPQGALAAVTTVLNPSARASRNLRAFTKAVRRRRNVVAIVEVDVRGLVLDRGSLVKVREFGN